jgi:osmotically-inducible protein OsmY
MKTDKQLQKDVIDELKWEPTTGSAEIGVAARDGVVTLSGPIRSYAQQYAAVRAAERVAGVKAVADQMDVELPGEHKRTDTDIAHAAVNALRWDIEVPNDTIKLAVDDGWVTLEGEVEWQYQKTAAERDVRYLTGVTGIHNKIAVKPQHVSAYDVSQRIKDALRRNAELEAEQITVEAKDGKVTLRGRVRSWSERRDAQRAAWGAPGVSSVSDEITVGA